MLLYNVISAPIELSVCPIQPVIIRHLIGLFTVVVCFVFSCGVEELFVEYCQYFDSTLLIYNVDQRLCSVYCSFSGTILCYEDFSVV